MPNEEGKKNGLLQTIFSQGDTTIKLLTMALIVISGGGNFFATQKSSSEREHQIDRAIQQVHDLHATLDETERRQRKALDNQTQILEHDTKLLQEVHEITVKLEQMRHVDQMRGAPP